jgi:hypothetical protein
MYVHCQILSASDQAIKGRTLYTSAMQPSPPIFASAASSSIKIEIAAYAARLVADHGLDYGSAKKKALDALVADGSAVGRPRDCMPENFLIDDALLEHLNLFDDEHPARVARMRAVAAAMMALLADFNPMLTGSVWKGIVADHVPIHIQVFCDNAKEVEFALLNHQIEYDAVEVPHFRTGRIVPALTMHWRNEPIQISLYDFDDLRGAVKEKCAGGLRQGLPVRGASADVLALLNQGSNE